MKQMNKTNRHYIIWNKNILFFLCKGMQGGNIEMLNFQCRFVYSEIICRIPIELLFLFTITEQILHTVNRHVTQKEMWMMC